MLLWPDPGPLARPRAAIAVQKGFFQDLKKALPVPIIKEDGLLGIAPGGQVIKRAGEFDAQGRIMEMIVADQILK